MKRPTLTRDRHSPDRVLCTDRAVVPVFYLTTGPESARDALGGLFGRRIYAGTSVSSRGSKVILVKIFRIKTFHIHLASLGK